MHERGISMNPKTLKILEFDKILRFVVDFAVSATAKERLQNLMPSNCIEEVCARLQDTQDTTIFIKRVGSPSVEGISDLTDILQRSLLGGVLSCSAFIQISDTLQITEGLIADLNRADGIIEKNCFTKKLHGLAPAKRLQQKITRMVLNSETLADDASEALKRIRQQIFRMQENVKTKLQEILKSTQTQKMVQESIVTMRRDRYVIPIKQEFRNDVQGLIHDTSATGSTVFIEPMVIVELNNRIRSLQLDEEQEVLRILKELTQEVVEFVPILRQNQEILWDVDYMLAKAKYAMKVRGIMPKIDQEKKIFLKNAKHPLLDEEKIVPIHIWLGEDFHALMITGPNTGGKTVALKTVGLFSLMTQTGLLIPADEGSQMCVFSNIFADIGDEQSIEQSLSTFSAHMKNIVQIIENATSEDLVLLDELGAGTDPQEGAALAVSILKTLIERQTRVIATTHYSELKVFALTAEGVENASCEFDVETLKPTYKLLIGVPGKSNAFAIAQKLGMSLSVLEDAKAIMTKEQVEFEDLMIQLEKDLAKAREDKEEARLVLEAAQKRQEAVWERENKLREKKEKVLEKAKEDARHIITNALHDIEQTIKMIQTEDEAKTTQERLQEARNFKQSLRKKMSDYAYQEEKYQTALVKKSPQNHSKEPLKKGEKVRLPRLACDATVLTVDIPNQKVTVQAGVMKMTLSMDEVERDISKRETKMQSGLAKIAKQKALEIKTEIDFRGSLVDNAVMELDKYLDDAKLAGLREVRIIHGKGTGALRLGIQQFLKNHPHVKQYRLGVFGEGDTGVTVVEIRS